MMIKTIVMKGFGKFGQVSIRLQPGLNVIYGQNEAGKTTLWNFILGMMYGITKLRGRASKTDTYTRYMPLSGGSYSGIMDIESERGSFKIQRNFARAEKETRVFNNENGKEEKLQSEDLVGQLWDISRETYINTCCIGQGDIKTSKALQDQLVNHMANMTSGNHMKLDVKKALDLLMIEKKKGNSKEIDEKIKNVSIQLNMIKDVEQELRMLEAEEEKLKQMKDEKTVPPKVLPPPKKFGVLKILLSVGTALGLILLKIPVFLSIGAGLLLFLVLLRRKDKNIDEQQNLSEHISVIQLEVEKNMEIVMLKKERLLEEKSFKEDLIEEYQNLKKQKEEIEYNNKAISMSIDALKELSGKIHDDHGSGLSEEISRIIAQITNGRYTNVRIDENQEIMVEHNHNFLNINYLSAGTVEQIYFALRFAAAKILHPKEQMPIMIDDIFGNYDEERLEKILDFLVHYPCEQILLFTCKKEVRSILERKNTSFSYITL